MCVFCKFVAAHILSDAFVCFSEGIGPLVYKAGIGRYEIFGMIINFGEFIIEPAGKIMGEPRIYKKNDGKLYMWHFLYTP